MVIIKYNHYVKLTNFTGISFTKIDKVFRKNNMVHRYYGPAEIIFNPSIKKNWWVNNQFILLNKNNQKEFIKYLDEKWLL